MNRFKMIAAIACVAVISLALSPSVKAQNWSNKTTVTFSERIEIPGVGQQFLPAGTYVFKLMDSQSSRHIVQILNESETHVYATILAIPNYRLQSTDKTVMTFRERPVGEPEAIRAWFYPGANWGQEFVYPKTRAVQLAKVTNEPVLAMPTELASNIALPVSSAREQPVMAMVQAPLVAVTPAGEEAEVGEVVESPPVEQASRLPQTASPLPLLGLIGLLSLGAGVALWVFPKWAA